MSSLPSSEQIAAIARQLLSERYGEDVIFNDVAELTGSSSSVVLRAKVAPTAVLQQRSIVIKYSPASGDPLDDAALIREVVSYQFTTALPEDVRPGPVLLAYDIDHRILVISDVGEADTFDHLLDIEDSSARVALLRTYMFGHKLFLLDEAFSALDELTKMELHAWYLDIHRRLGLTTLLITHSIEEALALSDRIYILKNRPGQIVADFQLTWSDSEEKEVQKLRYKQEILRILGV